MWVMCLGEEHTSSVLEGADCEHCNHFNIRKLRYRLALFLREKDRWLGSHCCRGSVATLVMGFAGWVSRGGVWDGWKCPISRALCWHRDPRSGSWSSLCEFFRPERGTHAICSWFWGVGCRHPHMNSLPAAISCSLLISSLRCWDRRGTHIPLEYITKPQPYTPHWSGCVTTGMGQWRDLDHGEELGPHALEELSRATDLALHATKQMCCDIAALWLPWLPQRDTCGSTWQAS